MFFHWSEIVQQIPNQSSSFGTSQAPYISPQASLRMIIESREKVSPEEH